MKQLIRYLFGFLLLMHTACDYGLSGSHYEDLNPTPEVTGDITLNISEDTVFVRGNLNLNFNINLPGRTVYRYYLTLDNNKLLEASNTNSGSYLLRSKNYYDGIHKLQLNVVANSGTGSLADVSGAEGVEVYKTWILRIDNSPPKPLKITSIKAAEGKLKVEWEKYAGPAFDKYLLIRNFSSYNGGVCATIIEPNQTSWIDNDYIGGPISYSVALFIDGIDNGVYGPATAAVYPVPSILSTSYNQSNQLTVVHSSTPFYSNFDKYKLSVYDQELLINGRLDTVNTISRPPFGGELFASLATYSGNAAATIASNTKIPAYGSTWGPFDLKTLIRPNSSNMYAISPDKIQLIDVNTLQVTQQRNIPYSFFSRKAKDAVSMDGNLMYSLIDDVLHKLNPATLETLETYEASDILPNSNYKLGQVTGCSNTNRLLVTAYSTSTFQTIAYVVDMPHKQIVKQLPTTNNVMPAISPDGKTIMVESNVLVEQADGEWQQLNISTSDAEHIQFHPSKPLFYTYVSTIKVHSTVTGQRLYLLRPTIYPTDCGIDAETGNLYVRSSTELGLYNLETGQELKRLKLVNDTEVFVSKNRVVSKDRYITF